MSPECSAKTDSSRSVSRRGPVADGWRKVVLRLSFLAAGIGLWYLLAKLSMWDAMLFPLPREVALTLMRGIGDGSIPAAVGVSLKRLCAGYGVAIAVGLPAGLVLGRVQWLDDMVGGAVLGLQALPSICWLPLAILWFGLSETAILFVIIMGSLMAIILSVRDGVRTIPPLYLRAARVLGATGWRMYRHVIFPATLPSVLTGAKLGWSFAWRSLLAAELLYVSDGLGFALMAGRELHNMPQVVAIMMVIVVIGLVADRLVFGRIERAVRRRWGFLSAKNGL